MSIIAHTYDRGKGKASAGLAAGLRWSVLKGTDEQQKSRTDLKVIRQQASLIGAQRYATYGYDGAQLLGLYTSPISAPGATKQPKAIHSLALVFQAILRKLGHDTRVVNAMLLVEPKGLPGKRVLIVIEAGQIVRDSVDGTHDALTNASQARTILSDHVIYTQHAEISGGEEIDWEYLEEGCTKDSVLKDVPRSPTLLFGIAGVVLLGVGWMGYQHYVVAPEKARQKRLAAQKANKTPEYLSLLRSSLSSVGWAPGDMQKQIKDLATAPMYGDGWALERRECSAISQLCMEQWRRVGGQLPALMALRPNSKYDVKTSNLDTAKLSEEVKLTREVRQPESLIPLDEAALQLRTALQKLANATVVVGSNQAERWPPMSYTGVDTKVIVVRAPVEITAPLPIINAALRELPPTVVMDSYTLVVGSGDVGNLFKVTAKGHMYAK